MQCTSFQNAKKDRTLLDWRGTIFTGDRHTITPNTLSSQKPLFITQLPTLQSVRRKVLTTHENPLLRNNPLMIITITKIVEGGTSTLKYDQSAISNCYIKNFIISFLLRIIFIFFLKTLDHSTFQLYCHLCS